MTGIEFIDGLIAAEQSKRTKRQYVAVKNWILQGCKGTVEWPTGVGKTTVGTGAVRVMRRIPEMLTRDLVIVVPTLQLKEQWEGGLKKLGLDNNSRVFVINSIVREVKKDKEKKEKIVTELLILDEIHRYAAKTFSKVFDNVECDFTLGLTATLKRLDKKHKILEEKCPIIDKMSLYEATKNKFIAPYREYNLGLEMTAEQVAWYSDVYGRYMRYMNRFHQDFDLMRRCSMGIEPKIFGNVYKAPPVVDYAERLGWHGNSAYSAYQRMMRNRVLPRGAAKEEVWGNTEHPYNPDGLYVSAINGMRCIREIKEFIYKAPQKREATVALLKAFKCKAVVFGEIISRAEEIHSDLPDSTVVYHSKMTKKQRRLALERAFEDPLVKGIVTAKALDQGFDYPAAQLGIEESRTSSPTTKTQRRGRVVRLHVFDDGTEKEAVFVNTYLKDTKDYDWLRKGLVGSPTAKWVDSVADILKQESALLEEQSAV